MVSLLKARDENDLMTVLGLHAEHVAGELPQAEQELEALCTLFEAQLEEHEGQSESWIYEDPLRATVYEKLYDADPSVRDRNMAIAKFEVRDQAEGMADLAVSIPNLKVLKNILRDRETILAEQSRYDW